MKRSVVRAAVAMAAASMAAGLAACGAALGGPGQPGGGASGVRGGFMIGLLLPNTHTARWAAVDRPLIERKVKELCASCTVRVSNASAYASASVETQQREVDAMIADGARVLIIVPEDYKGVRAAVVRAHDAHVPVVAYDRLANGPISAFSSYDSAQIGREQAQALLTAMGHRAHPRVVMINGSSTDPNTADLKRGALSALRGRAVIVRSYYTPGWIPQTAFTSMSAAIAQLGPGGIDGVVAANDPLAYEAFIAFKAAKAPTVPPIAGQGADLDAVRRLLVGQQYVSVYKSLQTEADGAARMAVALGRGQSLAPIANATVSNDTSRNIPAVLGTPEPVTVHTIRQVLIRHGPYTVSQICTPTFKAACDRAGLTG